MCVHYIFMCVYTTKKKDEKSIHSEREKLSFFLYTFLLQRASKASFSHYYLNSFFYYYKICMKLFTYKYANAKKKREKAS